MVRKIWTPHLTLKRSIDHPLVENRFVQSFVEWDFASVRGRPPLESSQA